MPAPLRDVPQEAIELIKSFEGIHDGDPTTVNLDPYLDPLDIWTIGWGHAIVVNGAMLRGAGNRAAARRLYAGDVAAAADQFLVWNQGRRNGQLIELAGLTRRRRAERAMFLGEDWRAATAPAARGLPPPARRPRAAQQQAAKRRVTRAAQRPAKKAAPKAARRPG